MISTPQIWAIVSLVHIVAVLMVIGQTPANEVFARIRDGWFLRELDRARIKNCLVANDSHLRFVVAKGLHTIE